VVGELRTLIGRGDDRPGRDRGLDPEFALGWATLATRALAAHSRVSPFVFAQASSELGDRAEAFKWLDQAFQAKSLRLPWLRLEASFDSRRAEPEYEALLARMGLR
jgi:hypothetical protein